MSGGSHPTGSRLTGDTMNENLSQREQLSALVDGQLDSEEWAPALQFASEDEGRSSWHLYHLVGDVLRSPELAHHAADSGEFLQRLQQRLAQEPVAGRPPQESLETVAAPATPVREAANAPWFHWKMLAGVASMAVVAVVGWNSWGSLQQGPSSSGVQLAAAPTAPAPVQAAPTVALAANAPSQVMLRDPRLDELLAAHKQFGATSALQMPAGFLRNATFEAPAR